MRAGGFVSLTRPTSVHTSFPEASVSEPRGKSSPSPICRRFSFLGGDTQGFRRLAAWASHCRAFSPRNNGLCRAPPKADAESTGRVFTLRRISRNLLSGKARPGKGPPASPEVWPPFVTVSGFSTYGSYRLCTPSDCLSLPNFFPTQRPARASSLFSGVGGLDLEKLGRYFHGGRMLRVEPEPVGQQRSVKHPTFLSPSPGTLHVSIRSYFFTLFFRPYKHKVCSFSKAYLVLCACPGGTGGTPCHF